MSHFHAQNSEHSSADSMDNVYTFPASFAQQRLWFLDRLLGANSLYNTPWAVQLSGIIDIPALQQSFNAIIARHEILRTSFAEQDGEPLQLIKASMPFQCELVDLSTCPQNTQHNESQRIIKAEANRLFDIKRSPLIRAVLLKLSEKEHILLVTLHHIISDGWSLGVLKQELTHFYHAFFLSQPAELAELPIQYADYAVWQRDCLQGELLQSQLSYWKSQLADVPVLNLPTDHPRPKQSTYRGAREPIQLSTELSQNLKALSQKNNITLFMTLLAAFQVLLHRYSGQDDIVVGSPIAGRNKHEIEHLIGFVANILTYRNDLSGNPGFSEFLQRVRKTSIEAYTHQDIPFEKLVAELPVQRDQSRHPLFQVMLVLQPSIEEFFQLPSLKAKKVTVPSETAKFDLTLSIQESSEGLNGTLEYSTDLYDKETIIRLIGHFQILLEGVISQPETPIAELPLLTAPERHQLLLEWNDTQMDYPKDKCIHQLFENQVELTPNAIAILCDKKSLTYQELNEQANKLAHYLRKLGVGPEVLVALCMQRSPDMLVALLGILKAGGAYIPLDPTHPEQRLEFFLQDIAAPVLLTKHSLLASLPNHSAKIVCLDRDWDTIKQEKPNNPHCSSNAKNLAYIIYTSGSTGTPKGVSIPHRNLVALISWAKNTFTNDEVSGVLGSTTYCFDLSIFEFFVPLTQGGQLILIDNALELTQNRTNDEITLINTVPSALTELLRMDKIPASVQTICSGGEILREELVDRLYQQTNVRKIIDLYGPTEDAIYSTICLRKPQQKASIGKPIANTQIYILDQHLQPVPIGVGGEIHLGGDGLAREYLNRPELTAEKFIDNPFNDNPRSRLYKTGDLARYQPDGNIEFLGRIDKQIKLRGFRIEPGEIESLLGQYPGINEVLVLVREYQADDKRLLAYLTHLQDKQPNEKVLRLFLKDKLPEYMVPSAFILLDKFPLTASGKIDRNALPSPDKFSLESEITYVAPRSAIEESLADIWRGVLNISEIGIHDNFFEKGGHSILAIQLLVRINKQFQLEFPLHLLFDTPTIAGLCVQLSLIQKQQTSSAKTPIKVLPRKQYQSK